jgi:hypothetical protein
LAHVVQQQTGAASDGSSSLVQRDVRPDYHSSRPNTTRLGVGETARLVVGDPAVRARHAGNLEWVAASGLPPGWVLGPTAPDGEAHLRVEGQGRRLTVVCRIRGTRREIHSHDIQALEPEGGYMRQAPNSQTRHLPGDWNVSFVGNQFLRPEDVSFHAIEFMEGHADAKSSPDRKAWKDEKAGPHQAGPFVDVSVADGRRGSQCGGDDWVSSGLYSLTDAGGSWPTTRATMTWRIPWLWRLRGDTTAGKQFALVTHLAVDYGGGRAELNKGGVKVSANAGDAEQWYFPRIDDNLDQIRGYYSRHVGVWPWWMGRR